MEYTFLFTCAYFNNAYFKHVQMHISSPVAINLSNRQEPLFDITLAKS